MEESCNLELEWKRYDLSKFNREMIMWNINLGIISEKWNYGDGM